VLSIHAYTKDMEEARRIVRETREQARAHGKGVIVTVSDRSDQLIAFTWYDDTYSLVCNSAHPCMHAGPTSADIQPGKRREIHGELIFGSGELEQFTDWFVSRYEL